VCVCVYVCMYSSWGGGTNQVTKGTSFMIHAHMFFMIGMSECCELRSTELARDVTSGGLRGHRGNAGG